MLKHSRHGQSGWPGICLLALAMFATLTPRPAVSAETAAPVGSAPLPPFARIGDEDIPAQTYFDNVRMEMRWRFYHGTIPADQRDTFLKEVGDNLVDRVLLLREAARRGLKADEELVARQAEEYERKIAQDQEWQANKETWHPLLMSQLRDQSLLKRLESAVRALPEPTEPELRAYYEANPDKFTMPMRQEASVILLQVDPGAGGEAWKLAMEKAGLLVKELKAGADFADMARNHSGDASAAQGGKMDNTHQGMIAPEAEKALEKIAVGEFTDPVMVLEGVAIFRLDDRKPARLIAFQDVRERAKQLLTRRMADQAWDALKKRLRELTPVSVHEEYYLPSSPAGAATPKPAKPAGKAAPPAGASKP
ncbi:MAG: peptidyl-prolyl cis-trans isomerase [Magnetococcales bacterium]|nr:peptidyl-prolyl cis-trans isomerase [Magnetococcales bacterium]